MTEPYQSFYQTRNTNGIKLVPTEGSHYVLLYSARRSGAQYNWGHLAMILIAIHDHNAYLFEHIPSNLQLTDFTVTTVLNGENLSAWLATHGVDMLALPLPIEHEPPPPLPIRAKPERLNSNEQSRWQLNLSHLELIHPNGEPIPLSHNECCVLGAAAKSNGNLVSRKTLIEALGQDFWHYDERRLEALISRLRRKLASYAPEGFPIRGVKGQGYLFGVELLVVESCLSSAFVSN